MYLGNHKCLGLEEVSRQSLGGPVQAGDGSKCEPSAPLSNP